jgi:hypothetical protein
MLKNIINNKFIALLCIAYFVFAQLSPIDGNHISKLWALLPLLLVLGVKKFPIKMFLYLSIIPLILTASLLFRETINIEGWTFVNIHLGCALFAFLAINNESVRNYFNHEKLCFLIIFFGASLIIITVVEFVIGIPPGRVIFGSQNLTSLTLTLTIPIAFLQIKNNKIKYLYIICAIISVAILIKSRGLSIVILLVTLFYLWNNFRNLSRNYKIAILLIISVLFTIIVIRFNQRYDDFIFGNTIHFRLYAWLRFIETVIFINPIFGYGPSNIVVNFNQYQYLYPQIQLVSSLDTFYNTHSDWIFFFASGGIVFLVIYLYLHFLLIFKYLTQPNLVRENKFLQISFVAFLVIILTAQYDINNTTYSTLLSFYLIKAFLFQKLVSDKYIVIKYRLTID